MTEPDANTAWCVLRTSGRSTLSLADALTKSGFRVWTPIEHRSVRKRRTKIVVDTVMPITPTFVFAAAKRLRELVALSGRRVKEQPDFSVFRYYDRYPILADASLNPLRAVEDKAAKRVRKTKPGEAEPYDPGASIRMNQGSWAGMSGVVKSSNGKSTLLMFDHLSVEIATFHLRADSAYSAEAPMGAAA